ncbi:MAG: DUF2271 domain-containing protein [Phenylobacterium sp.]|uniref:DUF2271 domain-containing protein n=1 Tax=Phenylobacterium sp. TaxID=1871053 RepID=UPI00271AB9BA|nr:DUF2271 domain-containing protein [Phenylobacterium sp.]MDO8900832.1 DUF2271 domain-containing protein [Phenylobacterium sp.]
MALISSVMGVGAALVAPVVEVADLSLARWGAEHVLGTSLDVVVASGGPAAAARAGAAVLEEIARLDRILSRWRPDSELALLNRRSHLRVSADLFAVVAKAEAWRRRTSGAFSSRLGGVPLEPGAAQSAAVRAAETAWVGMDAATGQIWRPDPVVFDLDGVAKGYILDRALWAARRAAPESTGFMLDLGGDIRIWSAAHRRQAWRLGVTDPTQAFDNAPPLQTIALRNGALAFSGRRARDGESAHVLNPHCGLPAAGVLGVAAIAPIGADADALATALAAMAPEDGLGLLAQSKGFDGLLVASDGRLLTSVNWSGQSVQAQSVGSAWPKDFALTATIEIPPQAGGAYERPYVAVWITDSQKKVVKTLLILGREGRWRESNYIYWRRVERMDLASVAQIARTTRAPGRYEVVWDGRDDHGRPAPLGSYTLNVEASREHGGHSFVALPLLLESAPANFQAEKAQELGVTRARFGPAR